MGLHRLSLSVYHIDIRDLLQQHKLCCITTNGTVKKNGEVVMGAGVAKIAKETFPLFSQMLGTLTKLRGLRCAYHPRYHIITFPVKFNWYEKASIDLIRTSAEQLCKIIENNQFIEMIYLPKPGCEHGGLSWGSVEPVIEPIFQNYPQIQIIDRPLK